MASIKVTMALNSLIFRDETNPDEPHALELVFNPKLYNEDGEYQDDSITVKKWKTNKNGKLVVDEEKKFILNDEQSIVSASAIIRDMMNQYVTYDIKEGNQTIETSFFKGGIFFNQVGSPNLAKAVVSFKNGIMVKENGDLACAVLAVGQSVLPVSSMEEAMEILTSIGFKVSYEKGQDDVISLKDDLPPAIKM